MVDVDRVWILDAGLDIWMGYGWIYAYTDMYDYVSVDLWNLASDMYLHICACAYRLIHVCEYLFKDDIHLCVHTQTYMHKYIHACICMHKFGCPTACQLQTAVHFTMYQSHWVKGGLQEIAKRCPILKLHHSSPKSKSVTDFLVDSFN